VNQAGPSIVTAAVTPVTVGAKIKDTATLSGLVDADGTGTVRSEERRVGEGKAAPEVLKSTSEGVSANGNVDSGEYTTAAAGGYYWVASYSGDGNTRPVSGWCGDGGECSLVNQAGPSIVTAAVTPVTVGAKIKDTATLSGLVDADGTGTV